MTPPRQKASTKAVMIRVGIISFIFFLITQLLWIYFVLGEGWDLLAALARSVLLTCLWVPYFYIMRKKKLEESSAEDREK